MSDEIILEEDLPEEKVSPKKVPKEKKLIEAALFMSPKPMTMDEFVELTGNLNKDNIRNTILEIKQEYADRNSSIEVFTLGDSYLMQVNSEYDDKVAHLASESEFSKSVTKTLALISFKQPVKQSLVIKYRNTKAYDHIKLLLEKELISRQRTGRTYILRTTRKFLEYFGGQKKEQKTLTENQ
ncbi:MAG: SMC-Scp complex subunit ScpB [Candidatus Diapherotrites archaeon]